MATLIERSSNPRLVRTPCGTVRTPWRHEGSSWFWFYSLARYPVGSVLVTCSRLGTKTWKTYRLIKKSGQNLWCGCKVSSNWPWCSERRGLITFDFERSADGSINAACQEGFLKIVLLLNEPSAAISILCNIGRGSTFGMVVPNPTSSRLLGTAKHRGKKDWLLWN